MLHKGGLDFYKSREEFNNGQDRETRTSLRYMRLSTSPKDFSADGSHGVRSEHNTTKYSLNYVHQLYNSLTIIFLICDHVYDISDVSDSGWSQVQERTQLDVCTAAVR